MTPQQQINAFVQHHIVQAQQGTQINWIDVTNHTLNFCVNAMNEGNGREAAKDEQIAALTKEIAKLNNARKPRGRQKAKAR